MNRISPHRMAKYLVNEKYIYYSVIISTCLYSCFIITSNFTLRILSFAFVLFFYIFLFWYVFERKDFLTHRYFRTNTKWILRYLGVQIVILLFSLRFDSTDLVTLFFHPLSFLAYFISFLAVIANKETVLVLRSITNKINLFFPLIILTDYYAFNKPVITSDLSYFILFELLFIDKLKTKRRYYIIILTIVVVLFENYYDNRAISLRLVITPLLLFIFLLFKSINNKALKWSIVIGSFTILYFFVFGFEQTYDYILNKLPIISIDRTDTRTFLFKEFFQDLKAKDWLYGRGYLGTYFSPWFYEWSGDAGDFYQRFSIEIGILQIILKGGVLLLIPFLLIMVYALRKGFINGSIMQLSFRFSLLLLVQVLLLGFENTPFFGVNYMILWVSVGIIFFENDDKRLKAIRLVNYNK